LVGEKNHRGRYSSPDMASVWPVRFKVSRNL
jgi:hypothetical protein